MMISNFIKMIIFPLISLNMYMMSSCTSFIFIWIIFEFNMILFTSLILNNSQKSHETSYIYFIPQMLASILFFFSCTQLSFPNFYFFFNKNMFIFIISFSLALKLGLAPMHFWYITVCKNSSWFIIFLLTTLMKIPPLSSLLYFQFPFSNWLMFIFFSMIFSIMGINSISLKKIICFSSMNHLSWIIMNLLISKTFMLIYLFIYIYMMIQIIFFFHYFNLSTLFNLFSLSLSYKISMFLIYLNFLSLSGLPPFIGFYIKFMSIKFMMFYKIYWMTLMMTMSSMISIMFYLLIISPSFLIMSKENKLNKMNFPFKNKFNLIVFMSLLTPFQMISFI